MAFQSFREAACDSIERATERLGDTCFLDKERLEQVCELCDHLEEMMERSTIDFDIEAVSTHVNLDTQELLLYMICDDMVLHGEQQKQFLAASNLANSVRLYQSPPGKLRIDFVVNNLWLGGYAGE